MSHQIAEGRSPGTKPRALTMIALALSGCVGSGASSNGGADGGRVGADSASPPTDAPRVRADAMTMPAPGPWVNVTANLAGMSSECGNTSGFAAVPDRDQLIVGVALHGLWTSTDGGASWTQLGTGAGSDSLTNRTVAYVFDPERPGVFWESGIYNGNGVYRSDDYGTTLHALGDAHHNDVVSIDFSDPNRRTLLAGGHEQTQTVYRSTDGGESWTNVGANLPPSNHSSNPLVIDATTHLVGCSGYASDPSGIFRTTDGGAHWSMVSDQAASGAPLRASDGTIYWTLIYGSGMVRSTDNGQSWTRVHDGGLRGTHPIELPDGRIATVGPNAIIVSSDQGESWQSATESLPYDDIIGLAYSVQRRAFYVWRFDCTNTVPADAIMRHDFDFERM
jgi:photosystem II stability/assembly factor-like uncharacterized protein